MQKLVLSAFLILLLVPFSQAFSQEYSDNAPTLTVSLRNETPFVYQDSEGYTVVVGAVENNNPQTSVANVAIQVNFYDDLNPTPLEVTTGYSTLEVIPANGQSPFAIRSQTPNPNITQASVSLLGFDSSVAKQKELTVFSTNVFLGSTLQFSGVLRNGAAPISDTNVYLAFYDGFEPPRILGVSTIEIGDVEPNGEVILEFDEPIDSRSVGFLLFSESNVFYSDFVDVAISPSQVHTKLVTISDVTVEDTNGEKLSELEVGSTVNIKSNIWIQFAADQKSNETAYTYYVQIKESGETPYVEYIGKFDGRFIGTGPESQTIDWVPEKKGLFFIETFVWDRNNVPIAERGPFVLVIVN
ncbi:MAG: hypothetical protein ACE5DT_06685 [Nitrosopumilus sp.]